ncbi:iron transporter FeoB [Vulcanibacillus modesticaldus]|uniref:Iron transporter FeoB n=1 Tax=Vulcanibacillus modesticaldus TaxID=337097 RepID=A0A1D2YWK3_9BACI|nr:FeoB small GTPase domain-containing protein [Vulcanibacillus modesticaldus]OEG00038.1 iron transporter FeoB [Vulcanibacillus modesticaldus]
MVSINNQLSEKKVTEKEIVVALAGNPNTGKSTIFNALTGLKQHTGNWPGKTVSYARGNYVHRGKSFVLVDLPGTYSLLANSIDELIARDFICFAKPDVTIVVTDATNLIRNLNLALQIMEATNNVVVAINLLDEAERKGIIVNIDKLSEKLGLPVVGTVARNQMGLNRLKDTIDDIVTKKIVTNPLKIHYPPEIEQKIQEMTPELENILKGELNPRWVALRILEGDKTLIDSIKQYLVYKEIDIKGEVALCH